MIRRTLTIAVGLVVALVVGACGPAGSSTVAQPPPPGWTAVYFHYLAIDIDRKPIEGSPVDIVADVIASTPAKFYDADTGQLRDYPISKSKQVPYILPFWYDLSAHASISTTAYFDSAAGDTLICYVSDKNGVELPGTRTQESNRTGASAQIQISCYYNF
jgi:hypothetical protein